MENTYDPKRILRVPLSQVHPNNYNPKDPNSKEYQNVLKSIKLNGFRQPILVREDGTDFEIVDGEQRYTACLELGFDEIYVYNLGEVDDNEAKALTLWFEVQVPFDKVLLTPLVANLSELEVELPYNDKQISSMLNELETDTHDFDVSEEFMTLSVAMTAEQHKVVLEGIELVQSQDPSMTEGDILMLLTGAENGL